MTHHKIRKNAAPASPRKPSDFLFPAEKQSWAERLRRALLSVSRQFKGEPGVHQANHDMVRRALVGMGPDSNSTDKESGARMVVNMSSVNVPVFCDDRYKNTYDLKASQPPGARRVSERRERVDLALPMAPGVAPENIYFGAVELNGAGMHYYGDVCLVLKPEALDDSTVVLDRNSFDVDRPPALDRIRALPEGSRHQARAWLLSSWAGRWGADLAAMATLRLHAAGAAGTRRWTTGQIARTLIDDEDYLEVLKVGSFNVGDVQEARLFSADAMLEAHIGSRIGDASPPSFEALQWRRRRIRAEAALRAAGITVRVVTQLGRDRG